jgi:hypothetical protein
MNREKIVNLLDRIPRITRYDKGLYRDGLISWSFNGNVHDKRSYIVSMDDGAEHSETNSWWNDHVDIICLESGHIEIKDSYGFRLSRETFFDLMPDDVKEEWLFDLDVFQDSYRDGILDGLSDS